MSSGQRSGVLAGRLGSRQEAGGTVGPLGGPASYASYQLPLPPFSAARPLPFRAELLVASRRRAGPRGGQGGALGAERAHEGLKDLASRPKV